jgi:hypothetical protein
MKVLAELRAAPTTDDRSRVLARNASLWADVKEILAGTSHGKCWYCESRDTRSDAAVDHFRPKNAVKECPEHEGYWWLAFDLQNYRYCCTYCNSTRLDRSRGGKGGKQTHFPLLNPENRVFEEGDCSGERPVLLDPTVAADAILLYFREDGVPVPRYSGQKHHRAERSIEIYHLHHTELIERRLETLNRAQELINLGRAYYLDWVNDADPALAFELVIKQLQQLCAPEAEYSTAVKDLIKGLRDDEHAWIDQIL